MIVMLSPWQGSATLLRSQTLCTSTHYNTHCLLRYVMPQYRDRVGYRMIVNVKGLFVTPPQGVQGYAAKRKYPSKRAKRALSS